MRIPQGPFPAWVDGRRETTEEVGLTVSDPAFHVGLGLFETIAARAGRVLDLAPHLERLSAAAERLAVPLPESSRLESWVRDVAADPQLRCGWVKIVATRGGRCFVFGGTMDPTEEGSPATAVLVPWRRNPGDPLCNLKTLNHAASLLGLEEAQRRGADEGLWLNTRGFLAEGSTSNLFVVRRGRLFTPAVRDGILPGVVRALALRAASEAGRSIHVGKLRVKRLREADEAFLTSSLRGIRPLIRFEDRPVGRGEPGAWTRRIAERVARMRQAGQSNARVGSPANGEGHER